MEWKKHLGIIIIQCFWITYLCHIYFKCVFVLRIHSILCSSPAPWCYYLSTSELACTSSFGLWFVVNLLAFFSVVFWVLQNAPPCLPHPRDLQGHSLEGLPCAQRGPFLMQDGARAHNLSTVLCYLTTHLIVCVCVCVNWITDILLLQNALNFFVCSVGKDASQNSCWKN